MRPPDPAGPPAPAQDPPRPGARIAQRLLSQTREEIARADSKAAVLVAALGMTAGVLSGLLAGRRWDPGSLSAPGTTLWWAGSLAFALSLLALLVAVLPRYGRGHWVPGQPLCYFDDVRQAAHEGLLTAALVDTERELMVGLTAALTEISRIAARKHQWIRAGLIAFCTGTVLLPSALLVG